MKEPKERRSFSAFFQHILPRLSAFHWIYPDTLPGGRLRWLTWPFACNMARLLKIGAVAFGGLIAGILTGFGSIYALAGAGHGWCSSVWSFLTVLFVPVLFVGFIEREPRRLRHIAWYVAFACLVTDGVLVVSTCAEGWSAVSRVWKAVPAFLSIWALLWFALHLAVARVWHRGVLQRTRRCSA